MPHTFDKMMLSFAVAASLFSVESLCNRAWMEVIAIFSDSAQTRGRNSEE